MPEETQVVSAAEAFEREGLFHTAQVATIGRSGTVARVIDDAGVGSVEIVTDYEYDDYDEEEYPVTSTVEVSPGDVVFDLDNGLGLVLKAAEIEGSDFRFTGEIVEGASASELSAPRTIAVNEFGDIVEYNAETGELTAVPFERNHGLAFVTADGDVASKLTTQSLGGSFQAAVKKADDVEFDMIGFFAAVNEGLHNRMEERGDVEMSMKEAAYMLNNAIEVAKAERESGEQVSVEAGDMRLTEDSWNNALESLGEGFQLPHFTSKHELRSLESMVRGLAGRDESMVKTARQIYSPITDTPMEDIRVYQAGRQSEEFADDPTATVAAHFAAYLERGERVEIPEATLRAVGRVYAPERLELVDIEEMRVLYVRDHRADSLYFMPKTPVLEAKPNYDEAAAPSM